MKIVEHLKFRENNIQGISESIPILLLDEGISDLDDKAANEIESGVLAIEDLTVITVTHKLNQEVLSMYDEIVVMENIKIIEQGAFDELVEKNGEFFQLYSV